jgi:hypothetical protein
MCLRASYKKKLWEKICFASLKSLKKGVGFGVRDTDPEDPDPHQNFTIPNTEIKVPAPERVLSSSPPSSS